MFELNQYQTMAVSHKDGPALVLAGPGSGKTLVITHRMKKLIEEYGAAPERILVITFTRAAAMEMKTRFEALMGGRHLPVSFGTFHSVYFGILKYAYRYDASQIIGEEGRLRLLSEELSRLEPSMAEEGMEFLEPSQIGDGKAFFDFTPRILYLNSRTHEDSREMAFYGGKLNHLYVDIFIQDELPEGKLQAAWTRLKNTMIYGLAMGHRFRLDFSKYSPLQKCVVAVLSAAGRLLPMPVICRMERRAALRHNTGKSRLRYYSNYQPDYLYVTLKKEWNEETVDLDFEDMKLMAPKNWHQVLTCIYGDYRKLPPPEKRVPTHSTMEIQVYGEQEEEI